MKTNRWNEDIICDSPYENDILELSGAGITNPNPRYKMLHNIGTNVLDYDYYNFEYVLSGKGYIETKEKTYTVQAGDFYFLNKLQYHVYYPDALDPFKKEFVTIRGVLPDKLTELYDLSDSVRIKRFNVHKLFEEIFRNLQESEQIPNNLLERQVFYLFQYMRNFDSVKKKDGKDIGTQIADYLTLHLQKNLTISMIAKDLHMSESSINHIFVKRYNCSVMQYFIQKKISYAKTLLCKTNYSVKDIAEYLAFNDEKYFSKCFKQHTACTPTEYRKKHLTE